MLRFHAAPAAEYTSKLLDRFPEVVRPQWLRETWTGSFGPGFETSETKLVSKLFVADGRATSAATYEASVHDPGWSPFLPVGAVERHVQVGDTGRPSVHHTELRLDEPARRRGFATAFNGHAIERYRAAGIDAVTVEAGYEDGGLVWAKQGFVLRGSPEGTRVATAAEGAQAVREIVHDALDDARITAAQFAELERRLVDGRGVLPPDALVSVQQLLALPDLGPAVLRGANWSGVKLLTDVRPVAATDPVALARDVLRELPRGFDLAASIGSIEASQPGRAGNVLVSVPGLSHVSLRHPESAAGSSGPLGARVGAEMVFAIHQDSAGGRRLGQVEVGVGVRADGAATVQATKRTGLAAAWRTRGLAGDVERAVRELDWG